MVSLVAPGLRLPPRAHAPVCARMLIRTCARSSTMFLPLSLTLPARVAACALRSPRRRLEDALKSRWYEEASEGSASGGAADGSKRVLINVGGQLFETTARVLRRDPGSALAQLADRPPPDEDACPDGAWFFERDWWTFRFVLQWLREGEASLPRSKPLLKALYAEARYFGMQGLRASVRRVYQRIAAAEAEAEAPGVIGPAHARLRAEAEAPAEEDTLLAGRGGAAPGAEQPLTGRGRAGAGAGASGMGWSVEPAMSGAFAASPAGAMEELLRGRHGPAYGAPLSVVSDSAGRY